MLYREPTWTRGGQRPDADDAPTGKRKTTAADLRPGDSYTFASESRLRFPIYQLDAIREDGDWRCWNEQGQLVRVSAPEPDLEVVVGYTNRKAKRQRCKLRRRARLAEARA